MLTPMHQPPVKLLLTMEEAAQASGLGRTFLYNLVVTQRRIASVKIGRVRRVPLAALERFIEEEITRGK
jgi:excisionase family DNA binding protein